MLGRLRDGIRVERRRRWLGGRNFAIVFLACFIGCPLGFPNFIPLGLIRRVHGESGGGEGGRRRERGEDGRGGRMKIGLRISYFGMINATDYLPPNIIPREGNRETAKNIRVTKKHIHIFWDTKCYENALSTSNLTLLPPHHHPSPGVGTSRTCKERNDGY